MNTFTFTDRTSYIAFRKTWKTEYKALSQAIRDTKAAIKQAYLDGKSERASILQSDRSVMTKRANQMMNTLANAKVEAQNQYLASKAEKEAA